MQDWQRVQVVWALREWNRQNPRLRPTPGDVLRMCIEARGKAEAAKMKATLPKPQEPDRPQITAADIARRAAFAASVLGGKRMAGIDGGDA